MMKVVQKILETPLVKEIAEAILGNTNCSTDPTQLEEISGEKVRRKKEKKKQKKEFSPTNFPTEFDSSQVESINAALNNTLTIIQGPPGSGKTKVACAILKEISKHVKGVLAVAETNIAVDNLCKSLIDMDVQVVRLGNIKDIARELYVYTLEGKLKYLEETRAETSTHNVKGQISHKKNLIKEVLKNADVVVTTCSGAGDARLNDMIFPFVLADEATQIKEATLLCPLTYGVKQLVLIGDPCQLNPSVNIHQTCSWISVADLGKVREALKNTLFHKLQKKSQYQHSLDTQYRMHPELAEYPSRTFYLGALKSGVTEEDRKPPWNFTSEPSIFVNTYGTENRSGTSFVNKEEVESVKAVVRELLASSEVTLKDIVVLALYKAQVLLLRKNLKAVEVNSIDGFQGREAEIIVASTVRSTGNLGFSDDEKRLNVLLTRAKRGLIVIGHKPTLSISPVWKEWIEIVTSRKCVMKVENFRITQTDPGNETQHETEYSDRYRSNTGTNGRGRGQQNKPSVRGGGRGQRGIRGRGRRFQRR